MIHMLKFVLAYIFNTMSYVKIFEIDPNQSVDFLNDLAS